MGQVLKSGLILLAVGVAAGAGFYGWKAMQPRQISVCAVSDYAFRARPNWEESIAEWFRQANRIFQGTKVTWKLTSSGGSDTSAENGGIDQRREFLKDNPPCQADVVVAFTGLQTARRSGSVSPFGRILVVVDRPDRPDAENARILSKGLASLFGPPVEPAGSGTIMTEPPESDRFSAKSLALVQELREYDLAAGTGGLNPEWERKAVAAIQAAAPEQAGKPGVQAHRTLALAFANERKIELAIPHLREAMKADPANVNVRAELGGALLQLAQIPEALKEMEEAVRLAPDDATVRAAYGNILTKSGDTEAGIQELAKAVQLAPKVALFRLTLGAALLREPGRVDSAIATLQEAVRQGPESQLAAAALTRAEAQKRRTLEAVAKLRQEAPNAGSAERLIALGNGELWLGNLDAASRAFEKAAEIVRPNGRAHASLAAVRYLRSDYAGAWKEVKLARAGNFEPPASLLVALKRKQLE